MKRVYLLLLSAIGAMAISCSADPNERLHRAVSDYLQQKEPTYEPVAFAASYRYTRKDSARFEWRKNDKRLNSPDRPIDSLERQVALLSVKDTTYIGQHLLHVYKVQSKVDSARFVVFDTGEVWQIWPNPY